MAQVKIYGLANVLNPIKQQLSHVIHQCVMEALGIPEDKKFQRFFPLAKDDFYFPSDRSAAYTIIEISLMAGRSEATRKRLVGLLFEKIAQVVQIQPQDIEISLHESPPCNWGFRGHHGDEIKLNYNIEV